MLLLVLPASVALAASRGWAVPYGTQIGEDLDSPMLTDPELVEPQADPVFPERLVEIWKVSLDRAEADIRRRTADAIVEAYGRGMRGLEPLHAPLLRELGEPEQHPLVRLAAAQAVVALDLRDAAPLLLQRNQVDDLAMVLLTDRAMAKWRHVPAYSLWLARVEAPGTSRATLLSAVESLGTVQDPAAARALRNLVEDAGGDRSLQLAAARALGQVVETGLTELAGRLSAGDVVDRLAATALLARHATGETEQAIRTALASDENTAVASSMFEQLLSLAPEALVALSPQAAQSRDPRLRGLAVEALELQADAPAVASLASLLADVHPAVRKSARNALLELEKAEPLKPSIREAVSTVLMQNAWQGLEQAAYILGRIDHDPAEDRLFELLDHPRPEVLVTAAAAIRWLDNPGALERIHAAVDRLSQRYLEEAASLATATAEQTAGQATGRGEDGEAAPDPAEAAAIEARRAIQGARDQQLGHLIQQLGLMQYGAAEPTLRKMLPKKSGWATEARSSAVWALGKMHQGDAGSNLVRILIGRLTDTAPMEPEDAYVRRQSAVALGRMNARDAVSSLEATLKEETGGDVALACRWAIRQITGQAPPAAETVAPVINDWFIAPLSSD